MKNILKYLLIFFSVFSWGQSKVIPNPQYILSSSKLDYYNSEQCEKIASIQNIAKLSDGIINTSISGNKYYEESVRIEPYYIEQMVVIDLQQNKFLDYIKLKNFSYYLWNDKNNKINNDILEIEVQTSHSELGPWTNVITFNKKLLEDQYQRVNDIDINIFKSARFLKIKFIKVPNLFKSNVSCSGKVVSYIWSDVNVQEIEFYEVPQINSSLGSILQEGQCTTLTAVASGETYLWNTGETTQSIEVCKSGTYTCQVTNTSFTGNQDHVASISISKIGTQDSLPTPNGKVNAVYKQGNTVYLGGDFNSFGSVSGSGAALNNTTALFDNRFARVNGVINTVISDNKGGWYVGGNFSQVGNYAINNLAHINSDGSVDANFKPEPNTTVRTLLLVGSDLYAGGNFTTLKTLTNNYLAKIDAVTGEPVFWNANVDGVVNSIDLYNDMLVVGGKFTTLGGLTRNNLGAIDLTFAQATTWNPSPNNQVNKVYVANNKLYVGGKFTSVSGTTKARGAGYSLPAFSLDGYDFGANADVNDILVQNNTIYVGGAFTTIGGTTRSRIAALNTSNALATTWNPNANNIVNKIALNADNLIVAGTYNTIGGLSRNGIGAVRLTDGLITDWNPNLFSDKSIPISVNALALSGSILYAGGNFSTANSSSRNNVAAVDAQTGKLLDWNPGTNGAVRAIYADDKNVYLGGEFTTVSGTITKNYIAQINVSDGKPTGWNPNANGKVNAFTFDNGNLYVGGEFTNIGGATRNRLAALSPVNGSATPFNPNVNGNVHTLTVGEQILYIGGEFTTINAQTKNRLAAYDLTTNTVTSFNANSNGIVRALATANQKLYVGGDFTNIFASDRAKFVEYDLKNAVLTEINPQINSTLGVYALQTNKDALYIAGNYNLTNQGNPIVNSSAVKISDGTIGYWQPQPNGLVKSIYVSDNKVYLGGDFTIINSRYQPYFASVDVFVSSGATPTITALSTTNLCAGQDLKITGTGFDGISSVKIFSTSLEFTTLSNTEILVKTNSPISGKITIANPLGETTSANAITAYAKVVPAFNAIAPICSGSSLSALPTTSTNGVTGTWSPALDNTRTTTYTFTPSAGQCAEVATMTITVNPKAVPAFNAIAPICLGSSLSALPTTSTNGVTGTWSPALDNTKTTTYTFTPNVGQCAEVATMTITVNPKAVPAFNAIAPICSGSSLSALPTTSTNGVTGTWSPALDNTKTTTYTFTPNVGQCAEVTTMTITVDQKVVPVFNAIAPICSGSSLSALPTTSTNGVTGAWSPALNNTKTTTYTFTPNVGQCAEVATMTITVNPKVVPTFNTVAPICSGSILSALPTTSTNGVTGTWSPALDNTKTTTYTFTPSAGQCAEVATMTITVNQKAVPVFNLTPAVCVGSNTFALPSTSTNGVTGTWSPALNLNIIGVTTYTFTPDAGQCASTTTFTLSVSSTIVPTFNTVAPICTGSSLSALPTTSTNGVTGAWSPALNNTKTTTYTFTPNVGQCAEVATITITVNPKVVPVFNAVAPICSGSSLSALPTTSTNGVTGTWSPALNNTKTTTYTFTPSTGQCAEVATMTITVNQKVVPVFDIVSYVICSGSSLSALPTTSTNGISGSWLPALDNTKTTTYTFTPNASQCTEVATITIYVNQKVKPTFNTVAPICSGSSLSALPTTSTNGVRGTWSPALDNTKTTTYTFTPNVCAEIVTMTIVVNQKPVVDVLQNVTAENSYILPELINGNFYTESGGMGIMLSAGQHITKSQKIYIYKNDLGCISESSFEVTITNKYPVISIIGPAVLMDWVNDVNMITTDGIIYKLNDQQLFSENLKFRKDNSWTVNWGNNTFPNGVGVDNGADIVVNAEGLYDIQFNLSTLEYSFKLVTLNVEDYGSKLNIEVYPNPTNDILNISSADFTEAQVYDVAGRLIKNATVINQQINISDLSSGSYILQLQGNNNQQTFKIIKQ